MKLMINNNGGALFLEATVHVAIVLMMGIIHEVVKHHVKFVRRLDIVIYVVQTKKTYNLFSCIIMY